MMDRLLAVGMDLFSFDPSVLTMCAMCVCVCVCVCVSVCKYVCECVSV